LLYCQFISNFEIKKINYSNNGLNYALNNIKNNKPSFSTGLPLILICSSKWNYRLINGYHRLAQHILEQKKYVSVKIFYLI